MPGCPSRSSTRSTTATNSFDGDPRPCPSAGPWPPGSPVEATAGAPTEASDILLADYGDFFEREVLADPTEDAGPDARSDGRVGAAGLPSSLT